jgi:hypothetical protein
MVEVFFYRNFHIVINLLSLNASSKFQEELFLLYSGLVQHIQENLEQSSMT